MSLLKGSVSIAAALLGLLLLMKGVMGCLGEQYKVLKAVVRTVSIYMVDVFVLGNRAAKVLFHNISVLKDILLLSYPAYDISAVVERGLLVRTVKRLTLRCLVAFKSTRARAENLLGMAGNEIFIAPWTVLCGIRLGKFGAHVSPPSIFTKNKTFFNSIGQFHVNLLYGKGVYHTL